MICIIEAQGLLFFAGFFFGLIETFVVASQPFWVIEFKPATQSTLNLIGEGFTITSLLIDPLVVRRRYSPGHLHLLVVDLGLRTFGRPLAALRIPI